MKATMKKSILIVCAGLGLVACSPQGGSEDQGATGRGTYDSSTTATNAPSPGSQGESTMPQGGTGTGTDTTTGAGSTTGTDTGSSGSNTNSPSGGSSNP